MNPVPRKRKRSHEPFASETRDADRTSKARENATEVIRDAAGARDSDASTLAHENFTETAGAAAVLRAAARCSRAPTSAFVVQNNCGGSTWIGVLLEGLPCSQRFRVKDTSDGAFGTGRHDAHQALEFARPRADAKSAGLSAGALIYAEMAEKLARHFEAPPPLEAPFGDGTLRPKRVIVAILTREPIFRAICNEKKGAMLRALKQRFGDAGKPRAREQCYDVSHVTRASCPMADGFEWRQDPKRLLCEVREVEVYNEQAARGTARLAAALGMQPIVVPYATLLCAHGALPVALRAALGEEVNGTADAAAEASRAADAARRRRLYAGTFRLHGQQTKMTPANSASAMSNVAEVAAYFAARGRAADARRMLAPSEACANVTTIGQAVWDLLQVNSSAEFGTVVDENAERARCDKTRQPHRLA